MLATKTGATQGRYGNDYGVIDESGLTAWNKHSDDDDDDIDDKDMYGANVTYKMMENKK